MRQSKNSMHLIHSSTCPWISSPFLWFFCLHKELSQCNCQKENMISDKGKFYWWVLLYTQTNLTKQPSFFPDWSLLHVYCAFSLFSSLRSHAPWKGIEQSDEQMYHTAHCLSAIFMNFLHLLMTLVANVNSGFVSLQIVFQVMIPEVQKYCPYEEPNEMP